MLINDEIELKKILGGVQQSISIETMAPFLEQAGLEFIEPVLGMEFFQELDELEESSANTSQKRLLKYLKIAEGYYALGKSLAQLTVAVGDVGMMMNVQGGMAAVPKWTYAELKLTCFNNADNALEQALQFLELKKGEKNADDTLVFKTWLESENFTISNKLFINTATEMTRYFPALQGSRRMFLKLRGYLEEAQNHYLVQAIGREQVAELLSVKSNATGIEKEAIEYLCYSLVHKSFSEAIPYLNINEDFRLQHDISTLSNNYALERDRRDGLKVDSDSAASGYMEKLMATLYTNANSTVFKSFFASNQYKVIKDKNTQERISNDPSKPYVVM